MCIPQIETKQKLTNSDPLTYARVREYIKFETDCSLGTKSTNPGDLSDLSFSKQKSAAVDV